MANTSWTPRPEPNKFTLTMRGNTLVEISPRPADKGEYQLNQRDYLKGDKAKMKEVERFVSPVIIKW
jgi:hypothetical protein